MKKLDCVTALAALMVLCSWPLTAASQSRLDLLLREFRDYSGARLVFNEEQLPPGSYHDIMLPLSEARQLKAARICLDEVKKYPPGYLGQMKLRAIGVFAACASKSGDGYRPYDKELGGYRYYGIWNGSSGIAAAYYTDGQLPLTFHHEVFHHIDGTQRGTVDSGRHFASDDVRFQQAVAGKNPYRAPLISRADLDLLKKQREGYLLRDAVSEYASKTNGEDQAETARHFLTTLSDSLVQIVEQPELPGSQRILHCLNQYQLAVADGPGVDWFVDVALGRQQAAPTKPIAPQSPTVDQLLNQLQGFALVGESGWDGIAGREHDARAALAAAENVDRSKLTPAQSSELVSRAAEVTHQLLRYRLRAKGSDDSQYAIWGGEDENGINWTLRQDLATFGNDARRLKQFSMLPSRDRDAVTRWQLKNLRLVARYYSFIKSNWEVSGGTQQVFHSTRDAIADALPAAQKSFSATIKETQLDELATRLPVDGTPRLLDPPTRSLEPRRSPTRFNNAYQRNLDGEIGNAKVRAAIRQVQPACVRFSNASGVCISPDGLVLTAAHVADELGKRQSVTFPFGQRYSGKCVAISESLDVALVQLDNAEDLPFAPLAAAAPEVGSWVCAIGQPGGHTPEGSATGYGAFHVSTGNIRGLSKDRLGRQMLGGTKHDAWTYWGHSGCPLFNAQGEIVAMHNSWDSKTAMRHAVTYEAIVYFLKKANVDFAIAQ